MTKAILELQKIVQSVIIIYYSAEVTKLCYLVVYTHIHWRRQWQLTLVLLPGKSHARRSMVGCSTYSYLFFTIVS